MIIYCLHQINFKTGTRYLKTCFLLIKRPSAFQKNKASYMKRTALIVIVILSAGKIYSQAPLAKPGIVNETWSDKPVLHTIDKKFETESAVILSDIRRIEYIDDT